MNEKFEITRVKRQSFFEMAAAHNHDAYEIFYLLSGNSRFFIEDTIYTINSGDFIIIPNGVLHKSSYITDTVHERFDIYVPVDMMNNIFGKFSKDVIDDCFSNPYISVPILERDFIEELLSKTEREFSNKDEFSMQLIESYINELMVFFMRQRKICRTMAAEYINDTDGISQKAAKYIFCNYNKNITLESISKYVNLSSSHFSKKFKDDTGFGFKEYLLNVRIKYASDYLLNTKKPICEIAEACGFTDSNYFGDVFRRIKGVSPSGYRKNQMKGKS